MHAARKPERLELIQNADAIIWDEALANHRECLEAVMREFDNFRGKVLILMFDAKQLLPVVPGGDHLDIVKASLFSSPHWVRFQRHLLIENMRLQHIADPLEQRLQVAYDLMIRGIGENTEVEGLVIADELLENEEESPTHKRFTLMGIHRLSHQQRVSFGFDHQRCVPRCCDDSLAESQWLETSDPPSRFGLSVNFVGNDLWA